MRNRVHRYQTKLDWRGSTARGYASYDRTHQVALPPGEDTLTLSADPAFRGRAEIPNPEQLLLAAASSCQLLSFLALAAREGLDVLEYEDSAEALMPEDAAPVRITRIILRPRVVVPAGTGEQVRALMVRAHHDCYIANTLNAEVSLEPEIRHPDGSSEPDLR